MIDIIRTAKTSPGRGINLREERFPQIDYRGLTSIEWSFSSLMRVYRSFLSVAPLTRVD
jgi:hypothetical protein